MRLGSIRFMLPSFFLAIHTSLRILEQINVWKIAFHLSEVFVFARAKSHSRDQITERMAYQDRLKIEIIIPQPLVFFFLIMLQKRRRIIIHIQSSDRRNHFLGDQ